MDISQAYRIVLENMHEQVYVRDLEMNLLYINPAAEQLTGFGLEEALGKKCYEIFGDEQLTCRDVCPVGKAIFAQEHIQHHEGELKTRTGAVRKMRVSISPFHDGDRVAGAVVLMQDITDMQKLEKTHVKALIQMEQIVESRKTSEANLKRAQAVAGVGSWHLNISQNILTWTEETYRIFAIEQGTPLDVEAFVNHVHPLDRSLVESAWQRSFKGEPYDIEHRILAGEQERWVHEKAELIFDANGAPIEAVGTVLDITERHAIQAAIKKNEAYLRILIKTLPDMIFLKDPDGAYLACNPRFESFFGAKEAEIVGKTDYDFVDKELADFFREKDNVALIAGRPAINEEEVIFADDGHCELLETIKTPMFDADGSLIGVLGIARDITVRKQAEEALVESEALFRGMFKDHSAVMLLIDSNTGQIVEANQSAASFYGYPLEKLLQMNIQQLNLLSPAEIAEKMTGAANKQVNIFERPHVLAGGQVRDVEVLSAPITIQNQTLRFSIIQDITKRKRAEEALRESRQNFQFLFDSIGDILVVASPEGRILFSNRTTQEKLGYSDNELSKMHLLEWHRPEDRKEAEEIFKAMLKGERQSCPLPISAKDGSCIPVDTRVWFGQWNDMDCVYGICKDLTTEQEDQQRFERIFHYNPSPMALSEMPSRLIFEVNDAFCNVTGYCRDEIIGKTSDELGLFANLKEQKGVADQLLAEGRISDYELQIRHKSGSLRTGLFSGGMISSQGRDYLLTIMLDITERKQAEKEQKKLQVQLSQLQKAESLGRMAGSIAHHFNNQLAVVLGNLELALDDLPDDAENRKILFHAFEAGRKAAEVSQQMLRYLGHISGSQTTVNLSDACRQSLACLQSASPSGVTFNVDFPDSGPIVHADAGQIQQVLTNVLTNAQESLPDNQGIIGLIIQTVSHEDIPTSNRFPLDWQPLATPYTCLEISDTGCGISSEDIEKIFDPFYTTKFTGRGMGLSVTLGILKTHNGCITVDSESEIGTVFQVYLPASTEKKSVKHEKLPLPKGNVGNGGTVLLVEDDASVRNMAKKMISRLGYKVIEAQDGAEAVRLFQEHQNEIDCVLSDLTMPRMNGWETLTALREKGTDVPVILASGYDETTVMAGDHPELPQGFLNKPYSMAALKDVLMEAIRL